MQSNLFVISPIGPEASAVRREADKFLGMVKDAVGQKYDIKRHDEQQKDFSITKSLYRSLDTAPLVVAYMGRPDWNANVMFEIGYRIATHKPILIVSHESDVLPFDVQDIQHVRLPNWTELDKYEPRKKAVETLASQLLDRGRPAVESSYPVVELLIDLMPNQTQEEQRKNSVFTMSSKAADHLFHVDSLVGMPILDARDVLEWLVDDRQWKHFSDEQDKLVGRVFQGHDDVTATIPFLFKEDDKVHPDLRGRAFLALIIQHHALENAHLLRVLYHRVPEKMLRSADGDYFYCDIESMPDLAQAISEAKQATDAIEPASVSAKSQPKRKDKRKHTSSK
jgi:hypothetical protein